MVKIGCRYMDGISLVVEGGLGGSMISVMKLIRLWWGILIKKKCSNYIEWKSYPLPLKDEACN